MLLLLLLSVLLHLVQLLHPQQLLVMLLLLLLLGCLWRQHRGSSCTGSMVLMMWMMVVCAIHTHCTTPTTVNRRDIRPWACVKVMLLRCLVQGGKSKRRGLQWSKLRRQGVTRTWLSLATTAHTHPVVGRHLLLLLLLLHDVGILRVLQRHVVVMMVVLI